MARLPAEVLIGRLVLADFAGLSPPPDLAAAITAQRLGGVVLFSKNIESPAQVAALTAELQRLAALAEAAPLLVAVDQEGGAVERLPLHLPGAMALGAAGSAAFAQDAGRLTGEALRAVGANVDFAPVLDVNTNPDNPVIGVRSFGADPEAVARLAVAYIRGLYAAGVVATGKHFPGHGDTAVDSHLALPVVAHGRERLEAVEFLPFRRAITAGLGAVMTGHVVFPAMDTHPATVSAVLLDGMLRRSWGFDGVVFTDSLAMAAVKEQESVGDAAVRALRAGADVLLALGGAEIQAEVIAAVRRAMAAGALTPERLHHSYQRVQRVRAQVAAAGAAPETATPARLPPTGQRGREIAEVAVTLVRNDAGLVPLPPRPGRVITLLPSADAVGPTLGQMLAALGRSLPEIILRPEDRLERSGGGGFMIVATHSRGAMSAWQREVVREAYAASGDGLVVVATGTPYDLRALPPVSTYLATYGREPALLRAAARVLLGEITPRGRLPVPLGPGHPMGAGVVW